VACVVAVAVTYFLVPRAPAFTISASPSTITISKGGIENITLSYHPNVPSNLSVSSSVSGSGSGVQFGGWINEPFTFQVVASENALSGTYTITLEAIDVDTGVKATTTLTVIVPETSQHQRLELSFFKGVWAAPCGEKQALETDVENMIADGINIFALAVEYEINADGTVELTPYSTEWEENPETGYTYLIRKAHDGGLGVYLTVGASYTSEGQFTVVPEEIRDTFIQEFTSACLHWAEIAEQENVELFSPINEPTAVLGVEDGIKWSENILPLVKQRFTGDVVIKFVGPEIGDFSQYGSIAGYEYASVHVYAIDVSETEFFDYLDETVLPFLDWCVESYNLKGYVFGEMGVPAADEEWQAQIFQRFFQETWDKTKGYFLCSWGPKIDTTDPFPDVGFTGHPAENVIREWYTLH